jgi:hypothetical protein
MALVLSGSIDISGSMTATTIVVSSPGAAGMVSSSAQITELVPLMQATASLNSSTSSLIAITNGLMAVTASMKAASIVSSSNQLGEIAGLQALTASLKAASIVSSSQQIQNYNTFARTGSVNTFYGSQNIIGDITQQTSLNSTAQFFLILRKSRGTIDTPLTVNVNDEAGGILFSGYDGTTWRNGAAMRAKITAVSGGSLSSDLVFFTGNGSPSAGTTRLTIDSSGYLRLAGAGIQFNGDTADANSLDDYEEGTFTATVVGGTTAGAGTYSRQVGVYTKIGNLVTCNVWIQWSAHTGTGDLYFAGLPFTSIGTTNYRASGVIAYFEDLTLTAGFIPGLVISPSSTQASVPQNPVGGGAIGSSVQIDTAANIHFSITYQTT